MWPFTTRRCRCGHPRKAHSPEWAWTDCTTCQCTQFRWVRARWFWDRKYRRAHRAQPPARFALIPGDGPTPVTSTGPYPVQLRRLP
jgi:hypothetical protein